MEKQGKETPFYNKLWFGIVVALVMFCLYYAVNGGMSQQLEKTSQKSLDNIYAKVASDAVDQYNISKRQGDKIQICVQAMQVSAAYLQAKDESSYQRWKTLEKLDCQNAGMPQ